MADAREKYIASQAPRKKRTHPARSAQALNTSGAGIVHRNMMDLQRHPNLSGADVDRLKGLRRDWNRNRKYTDAGMAIAGASTPQEAQKYYMDTTENFRQGNKGAYRNMYPLTGGFMDVAEKGGILGTILSQIGKMGKDGGIPTAVGDTIDAQEEYVAKTFGPLDIHPGTYDIYDRSEELEDFEDDPNAPIERIQEEVYEGPWPHEKMPYLSDEAAAIQKEFNTNPYFQNLQDPNVVLPFEKERRGHPHLETYTPDAAPRLGTADPHEPENITVAPWLTDPSIPMPEELTKGEYLPGQYHDELIEEEVTTPIATFNDTGRESGIRGLHKYLKPNKYEDEFRAYIESGGDFMPYHQFERLYEKIYQGKPHALHSSYR